MTEYCIKINEWFLFSSDKTLDELGEMSPPELYKHTFEQMLKTGDFFGNGIQLMERIFKDNKEYSKTLENHRYSWLS